MTKRSSQAVQEIQGLVIGMDRHDGSSCPQLSNGIKDAEEVAKGLTAQGFQMTLKKDLTSAELDAALKNFLYLDGAAASLVCGSWRHSRRRSVSRSNGYAHRETR